MKRPITFGSCTVFRKGSGYLRSEEDNGSCDAPEVTSMLQRVFSSAYHADEFNAAHNAALSLARLYGHVNDRQTLEIIRRPSRDPDAPSETGPFNMGGELAGDHAPALRTAR